MKNAKEMQLDKMLDCLRSAGLTPEQLAQAEDYIAGDGECPNYGIVNKLDAKVKRPANVFGYAFGSLGAIVMGSGMSLVMTDIGEIIGMGDALVPGIVIGIVGMVMALVNYPVYKKILGSRRKKYAEEVIALSNKITAASAD